MQVPVAGRRGVAHVAALQHFLAVVGGEDHDGMVVEATAFEELP